MDKELRKLAQADNLILDVIGKTESDDAVMIHLKDIHSRLNRLIFAIEEGEI